MLRLMTCMNSSILPANDCSFIGYLSIVGIAPVRMTVFGLIFFYFSVSLLAINMFITKNLMLKYKKGSK